MPRLVHPAAGVVALLTIASFWIATVVTELSGSLSAIVAVKQAIPWGLLLLVPALALTGATGMRLAAGRDGPVVARKRRQMPFIAANGLLVLVPSALYLAALASRGDFSASFYVVQAIELAAGIVNIVLFTLNIRDGLRLTGRRAP